MLANIYILYCLEQFKSSSFSFFLIYIFILFLFFWGGGSNVFTFQKNTLLWFALKFYWLVWEIIKYFKWEYTVLQIMSNIYLLKNFLKQIVKYFLLPCFSKGYTCIFRLNNSSLSRTVWPNAGCRASLSSTW